MFLKVRTSYLRKFCYLASSLLIGLGTANAESTFPGSPSESNGWSSSTDGQIQISTAAATPSSALPSAPAPSGSGSAQSDRRTNRYGLSNSTNVRRYTFELGAGFNAPMPEESSITWGANFTAGGGINFSRYLALMAEFQFIHDKLPGRIISQTGASGGYDNIWSFTLDPIVDLFPYQSHDLYITGGGGFYHKTTNFTDPMPAYYCDFFYGYCGVTVRNTVVGSFSTNQGGVNIGLGYQHRFSGMYGEGHTRLFAEARYLNIFSPAVIGVTPGGLGVTTVPANTRLIPVTFGIRW